MDDAFAHHTWATLRLLESCVPLTPKQLAATVPGTYGSILATLRHLVGGDLSYLFLLTGGRVAQIDEERMDVPDLRAAIEANVTAWPSLLAENIDPDSIVVRHREDGSESLAPMSIRLAQAIQHGTDHRSQICTALTTLGIEPPDIDVWAFADSEGRISVRQPGGSVT